MWKIIIILLFFITVNLFSTSLEDQLDYAGFSEVKKYFDMRREKKTSVIIDDDSKVSKTIKEANKLYSDLYDITPVEEKEIPEKVNIYYFPGLLTPSFYGLTGLNETVTSNTIGAGKYRVSWRFQYKRITKKFGKEISGKAEVVSYPLNVTMGLVNNFELGFSLPLNIWKVDSNDLVPFNEEDSSIGDPVLFGKFRIPFNKKSTNSMSIVAGFKFPSGNDKILEADGSTGQTDFTMLAVMSAKVGLANAHLNVGYTFTGDPETSDTNYYSDNKVLFRFGFDHSHNENVTISLEFAGEDWGKNGSKMEVIPGAKAKLKDDMILDIAMPIAIDNTQYFGYRFRISAGMSYLF